MSDGKVDILIDLRDGGDWSLDLCFAGLQLNGVNVLDVPYKAKHREWWNVLEGRVETNWGLERRTLGFNRNSRNLEFHSNDPDGLVSLLAISHLVDEGLVGRVWIDERMESFHFFRNELHYLFRSKPRVVVVAGHDRFWNHSPEFVASLYGEMLEGMLLDNWYDRYESLPFKARRIGWSCNFDHYWIRPEVTPEKDIDVSFIGYNSHPDRERYVNVIKHEFPNLNSHLVLETTPDTFSNFIPKKEYFNIIQRSKVALNLRGAADRGKTMRAYEIPYVGSFMLSQQIEDPGLADDFIDGVHCHYFDSDESLVKQVQWAILNESKREYVARAGHMRAVYDLSVAERWSDVLKWLNGCDQQSV